MAHRRGTARVAGCPAGAARPLQAVLILLLSLCLAQAAAAELRPDDFAYGYRVEVDGAGAVYSLKLPHDVYARSVWGNLADVRVFNAAGEVVPHEFRHAAPQIDRLRRRVRIPYYPLAAEKGPAGEDASLEIRRNVGGEIVGIDRKSEIQLPARAYLLDLEKAGPAPFLLRLQWKTDGTGVLLPVEMATSDDLLDWRRFGRTTLADLEFMGNRLQHRDIVLEEPPGRYLRLDLGEGGEALRVTGVVALSGVRSGEEARNWVDLPLTFGRRGDRNTLSAGLEATVPVDRVQLLFPQPNSMLKARIETRSAKEPYRYRATSLFYELVEEGVRLLNEPLHLGTENVRYVLLEILQDGAAAEQGGLQLRLGYLPHTLVFIARGPGPYLLAYGNGRLQGAGTGEDSTDLHSLAGEDRGSVVRSAVRGERLVLGGEERLARRKQTPWKNIVLWTVLAAGAAALAATVWSLRRGGKGD